MISQLSVVVATRDRPAALRRCLDALARQSDVVLETIVVDDGSKDSVAVRNIADGADAVYVAQPRLGVSAARNVGVARALSQYVAFIDDDTEPDERWAATVVERLAGGATAVAGPVLVTPQDGSLALASQLLADCLLAASGRAYAPGANLASRADVLRVIPFDTSYVGIGAEDRDWCARLEDAGGTLAFEPVAIVRHKQQLTFGEFCRRQFRYGRGAQMYRVRHEGGRLERPGFYARVVTSGFRLGPAVGLLICFAQVVTAAGYVRQRLAGPTRVNPRTGSRVGGPVA